MAFSWYRVFWVINLIHNKYLPYNECFIDVSHLFFFSKCFYFVTVLDLQKVVKIVWIYAPHSVSPNSILHLCGTMYGMFVKTKMNHW